MQRRHSETSDNNAYRTQQTGLQKRNNENNHNREEDLIMLKENEEDDNEAAFMPVWKSSAVSKNVEQKHYVQRSLLQMFYKVNAWFDANQQS